MSESDSSQKTEEPTSRKLQQARDDGQVARSVELPAAAVVLSAVLMLLTMGGLWMSKLSTFFAAGFTFDRTSLDTPAMLPGLFASQLLSAFALVLPIMLVTMVAAIVASGATGGYLFSFSAIMPKLSKLSPLEGFKRMFGSRALVELLKAILKFSLVGGVLILLVVFARRRRTARSTTRATNRATPDA